MRVHTKEITTALRRLGKANRRSGYRNLNLAGRLMTSFAVRDTKRANPQSIRGYMQGPARQQHKRRYRGRRRNRHDGTRAAAIIGAKHRRKGIRTSPAQFYKEVRQYQTRAVRSAGYHRAGFIPAIRSFRAYGSRRRGSGRYRGPIPGRARAARRSQGARPHGFIENSARGIAKVQPNVLRRQVRPVARQLTRFARQDMMRAVRRVGFR